MTKSELEALAKQTIELEEHVNSVIKALFDKEGETIAMNVMLNVGTSMLAKALLLAPEEARDHLVGILAHLIDAKMQEGEAVIESYRAISSAMMH